MKIALNEPLLRFFQQAERPRISLYFPTHRAGPETRQDPIRLKNLLRQVREQLQSQGHSLEAAEELLQPVSDLIPDLDFWRHLQEGLGILVAPGQEMRVYKLPYLVPELAVAGGDFHLKPLLPLFAHDDHFHLLALNKSSVQLYQANRYSLRKVDVPGMATSLAEALQYDDGELQLQHHLAGPTGVPGQNSAVFHGQGGEKDIHTDQLLRFFRAVNKGVRDHLHDSRLPLVLAGVEYFFPIYREANTYGHLIDGGVSGSIEGMSEDDLRQRAWKIAEPHLLTPQHKAIERYQQMANGSNGSGSRKTAAEIEPAVVAAFEGRVDALIIPEGRQIWGEFHEASETVKTESPDPAHRRDLLDFAAFNTLLHGGEVFVIPPDQMPNGSEIAALLRFNAA
jgi:hypothetical protein